MTRVLPWMAIDRGASVEQQSRIATEAQSSVSSKATATAATAARPTLCCVQEGRKVGDAQRVAPCCRARPLAQIGRHALPCRREPAHHEALAEHRQRDDPRCEAMAADEARAEEDERERPFDVRDATAGLLGFERTTAEQTIRIEAPQPHRVR